MYQKLEPVSVPKTGTYFGCQQWKMEPIRTPKLQQILLSKAGSTFAIILYADMVLCKKILILCERLCCSGRPATLHRKPHAQQYPLAGLTLVFACLARRVAVPRMCAYTVHTAARNRARNCLRHARGMDLEPFQVSKIGT